MTIETALDREQRLAREAVQQAVRSGADNAQKVLDMVSVATLLPLLFVAFPVTLGRIITSVLGDAIWPDSARNIASRNERDVASMIVGGLLAATFIATGVVFSVRRERRRKQQQAEL